jgi:hypothetical protein
MASVRNILDNISIELTTSYQSEIQFDEVDSARIDPRLSLDY